MENYLNLITKIKPQGWAEINGINCCIFYYVGENFVIEVNINDHDRKCKNDLANLWVKNGYVNSFLPTTIHIRTYYTTEDGRCYGRYNIQLKQNYKINFDYMLEATQENINYLVSECIKLYINDDKTNRRL